MPTVPRSKPDMIVACVVGDGETETDRLPPAGTATSFESGETAACCDPASERLQDRQSLLLAHSKEVQKFFLGMGYKPYFVEGRPESVHQQLAGVMDTVMRIGKIWTDSRNGGAVKRPPGQ